MHPTLETLPPVALNVLIPLKIAGYLKLPAISVPIDNGAHFATTKAASPPELPPQVLELFQGFLA